MLHELPFHFVIPHHLISAQSPVDRECLDLPPTVKAGGRLSGPESKLLYIQPLIVYIVKVTKQMAGLCPGHTICETNEREVLIMPHRAANAPIETTFFPGEYLLSSSAAMKHHAWNRSLGRLTAFSSEPRPVNILTSSPRASTIVHVRLLFEPDQSAAQPTGRLDDVGFDVRTRLRCRTFYSIKELSHQPSLAKMKRQPDVQMRSELIDLQVSQSKALSWQLDQSSPSDRIVQEDSSTRRTACLAVAINVDKAMVPSFRATFAARRYSIILEIRASGFQYRKIELEVPVQIICYAEKTGVETEEGGLEAATRRSAEDFTGDLGALRTDNASLTDFQGRSDPPAYTKT